MRQILPLRSRPGVPRKAQAEAPCGCMFALNPYDDLLWDACAAHAAAPDLVRLLRASQRNVEALPRPSRGQELHSPLYVAGRDLLRTVDEGRP